MILLALIGLSNLLNRFMPLIPTPLFQIGLGVLISLIPPHIHLPLNPELFFVLFVAPLLFNDGKRIPRDELWQLRAPILLMALGLVLATVLVAGYYVHLRIPGIPLAAAFALAAILSPTDAVAVGALAGKIKLPKRILRLLEGESLMNDASGLVAFKFAVAAAVTGAFSLAHATLSFFLIAIGGLLTGLVLSLLIIRLRVWIRGLGMEDVTFHMLVQILTPFFIYLAAEEIGVSGILAVVAAGLIHAVERDRLQIPQYKLQIASDSTWSVILFLLNGLVFVILGLQLPDVARTIFQNPSFSNLKVIGYILEISLLLIVLRFLWVYFFWKAEQNTEDGADEPEISRFKSSLLTALSGVRGTVTLAGAFSIPYALGSGAPFPQRDLIIFIAAGVILCTLLTASLLLPLFSRGADTEEEDLDKLKEQKARILLLEKAISVTKEEMTEENRDAALELISYYNQEIRLIQMEKSRDSLESIRESEQNIRMIAVTAERTELDRLQATGEISAVVAEKSREFMDQLEYMMTHRPKLRLVVIKLVLRRLFSPLFQAGRTQKLDMEKISDLKEAKLRTCQAAVQAVSAYQAECRTEPAREAAGSVLSRYKEMIYRLQGEGRFGRNHAPRNELKKDLRIKAMQAERDEVQHMYERGKISRKLAGELRQYINLVETFLLEEEAAE